MAARKKPKQRPKSYNLPLRNLFLGVLIVGMGFGALVYQLYQLQIVQGEELKTQANAQQVKDDVLQAARGSILDAQGRVLAKTTIVWNIEAGPNIIATKDEHADEKLLARNLAADLAPVLNLPEEELYEKLSDYESKYKVLTKGVEKPVADKVEEIRQKYRLGQGITLTSSTRREYPYGNFASSVIGFVNSEGRGTITGVEVSYDEVLAGKNGRKISAKTRLDGEMATDNAVVYPAEDGSDVVLTIDADIQTIAEKYAALAAKEHNAKKRVTVIVMDVNTGAILALANKPDFDPNQPSTILDTDYYNSLLAIEDEEQRTKALGDARSILWRNKAISEVYDPGSVFKAITAAAAMDAGTASAGSGYQCNNSITILGQHYSCFKNAAHGWQSLGEALKNSCNVAFIQMGQSLGVHNFSNYFNAFGLTGPTGIDLPNESKSIYHPEDKMTLVDLASSSFGQGIGVTAMQMITAASAVVNGGDLVTPYIVAQVKDKNGNVLNQTQPVIKRQVVSEEVSESMRGMMENIVKEENSSCRYANVFGYRIGGKSGTSDKLGVNADGFASSFLGVAPINNPEIAVLAVVDAPESYTDLTTYIAVPIVGNILAEIMPMLGIQPEYSAAELAKTELTVPSLAGEYTQHVSVAQTELNQTGFTHRTIGSGMTVTHQYPAAGTKAPRGSCVYIYTESDQNLMATVPDVKGLSAEQATQVMQGAALNIKINGTKGVCVQQSSEVGAQMPMGTIVEVTLGQPAAE